MSSGRPSPGDTLSRYRIVSRLGAGGMGEVYLARDLDLDRDVALKLLPPEYAQDSVRTRRFLREARAASALRHPNVAHIYEVGEHAGLRFIAMEYVEGATLASRLGRGPTPVSELLDLALQITDALDESHQRGVVHRDIKAGNVIVTPRGQVKLLDFGLARMVPPDATASAAEADTQTVTTPGVVLGTPEYMSPEQALGRETDHRSDLFSLGVLFYEMAAGKRPFTGPSVHGTLHRIVSEPPEPLRQKKPDLPAELERIIHKCLEKVPGSRYQSARDLLVDLKNLKRDLESGPVASRGVAVPRPARRRALLAGVTALVVIGAAVLAWRATRGRGNGHIDSIAVLPFVNASGDTQVEYLGDGITEQLINAFTQIPNLKVIARTTVFTYKGRAVAPQKVREELGVAAVLSGRIALRGSQVSIQADLVDARDGSQLWGQQFTRAAAEMPSLERTLVTEIAAQLRPQLSGEQQKRLVRQHTADPEAHRMYLLGRYYLSRNTRDDLQRSLEYQQKAVALDPDFALAYAGLADGYSYMSWNDMARPAEAMPKAREAALKALALDDSVGEAHTSLGIVKAAYEWDWEGAGREFRRCLELNPGSAYGRHWYAHYLDLTGQTQEGMAEMNRARALDPLSMMFILDVAIQNDTVRQPQAVLAVAEEAFRLDAQAYHGHMAKAIAYDLMGRRRECLDEWAQVESKAGEDLRVHAWVAEAYGRLGRREQALGILSKLKQAAARQYVDPFSIALVHIGLGEKEEGLKYMEEAAQARSGGLVFEAISDRRLDPVRGDPRFIALVKRIGYPQLPVR